MPELHQYRYKTLLQAQNLTSEKFVRHTLGIIEADLRVLALLSLQEWASTDITTKNLFTMIGRLQNPTWGDWDEWLIQLRKLHNKTLATADKTTREKIGRTKITELLALLDENIKTPETAQWLKPLFQALNPKSGKLPRKMSLQKLLALPIGMRNRIAHDAPRDDDFWQVTESHLRPLVQWFDNNTKLSKRYEAYEHKAPWFIEYNSETFSYNGLSKKRDDVKYLSSRSTYHQDEQQLRSVLLMFYRLMGQTKQKEQQLAQLVESFTKEFGKLAPEKSQGVFIGDFLVGKKIGEGGHATVHKGTQLSTGRPVAIKMLKDSVGSDKEFKQRFKQEANILSRFNRTDIVSVIGYGEDIWQPPRTINLDDHEWYQQYFKNSSDKKTYIALEWIEGKTLADYFQSAEKPDDQQLTHWFISATEALARVHEDGYIHRDVTPSNIMIRADGQLKLMDFGIARSSKKDRTIFTLKDTNLGTYVYMSPEQIVSEDATAQVSFVADIYGLSATFYELYTQQRFYGDEKTGEYLPKKTLISKKQQGEQPLAPKKIIKDIAWELDTILRGGLENDPADRYKSMVALKRDLQHFLHNEPIEYKQPTIIRRMQLGYRRNYEWLNVAAGALLVIAGLTGWYIHTVTFERDRANNERDGAIELINYMNFELRDKLEPMGKLDIMNGVQQRINSYFDSVELNDNDQQSRRQKATGLLQYATTLLKQGKLEQALKISQEALKISQTLTNSDPSNVEWQRGLSISYEKLGNIYQRKDKLNKALGAYQGALKISQTLTNNDPSNTLLQRDLSIIYDKQGNIYQRQIKLDKALDAFQRALKISQTLSDSNPSNIQWQQDLSASYNKLGNIYQLKGEADKALDAFQEALKASQILTDNDPNNIQWKHDLFANYHNLGWLYLHKGKTNKALEAIQKAMKIGQILVNNDPSNVEWQRGLSESYNKLGNIYHRQNKLDKALKMFQKALKITQTLANKDPSNVEWQAELSTAYNNLGDIYLYKDEVDEALEAYQEMLKITQILANSNPSNLQWQSDLSMSYNKLGAIYQLKNKGNKALKTVQKALKIAQTLANSDPSNIQWQSNLLLSYNNLETIYYRKSEVNKALKAVQKTLQIAQTLAKSDPSNVQWQRALIINYGKLSELLPNKAKDYLQQALVIVQHLKRENRLAGGDQWMEDDLKQRLKKTQ